MNCINLQKTIDQGLNQLRQVEFGSEQYKNGSTGLAKLIEAESKQIEADTKSNESDCTLDMQKEKNKFEEELALKRFDLDKNESDCTIDMQKEKNKFEEELALKRFDLDKSIAERELEVKQLQLESETKTSIIKVIPAVGAGLVCLAEIGVQAHLEETGHLWSPLRGLSNLSNKLRLF